MIPNALWIPRKYHKNIKLFVNCMWSVVPAPPRDSK